MSKLVLGLLFLGFAAQAGHLRITKFYRVNPQNLYDKSADLCFELYPAPRSPMLAQVTVDMHYQTERNYSAWIDERGEVCIVVSTFAGRANVHIPESGVSSEQMLL